MAGVAAPSMGEERLDKDLGVIRACGSDIWRLCSHVLPDVGRMKACVQDKMSDLSKGCRDTLLDAMAGSTFKVCKNETYALCAAARCNVFDGVAYCQCDVKHGDSISLPFPMGKSADVCSINAAGADNKYMISTYSLPESIASPQAGRAVYTCSGDGSGAYAQCDGGICFRSTEETNVPGLRQARAEGANHLFVPHHTGQAWCGCAKLSNPGALSLRQVLLPVLQWRHRQQQDGLDDLCRRSDWHGPGESVHSSHNSCRPAVSKPRYRPTFCGIRMHGLASTAAL
jgi:hypothetical protein